MRVEHGWSAIKQIPASIVTVGSFDGVHAGHQAILSYVIKRAAKQRACSTLVTFEPHPQEVLTGKPVVILTTMAEKAAILRSLGLNRLVVVEFSKEFARMLPEDYVQDILVSRIGLQEIIVGHDHGFGRNRSGDVSLLRRIGADAGFSVDALPAEFVGSRVAASRAIRRLLMEEGDVAAARTMLTRPYKLTGHVVRGAGRGRTIGVPTANILLEDERKVVPRRGVYVVQVTLNDRVLGGMMNIGYRPTVEDSAKLHLEVHLFDFTMDIYGKFLKISFLQRLRDEKKFGSIGELKAQLQHDAAASRAYLYKMELTEESSVPLG